MPGVGGTLVGAATLGARETALLLTLLTALLLALLAVLLLSLLSLLTVLVRVSLVAHG